MNTTWIEINLPFSFDPTEDDEAKDPLPDIEDDIRAQFGHMPYEITASINERWPTFFDDRAMVEADTYDHFSSTGNPDAVSEEDWQAHMRDLLLGINPEYDEALRLVAVRNAAQDASWNHPEMKAWDARTKGVRRNRTFTGRGLALPGVQVEMADGSRHLIGDINKVGGVCDDCTAFDSAAIVTRYRVLIPFEMILSDWWWCKDELDSWVLMHQGEVKGYLEPYSLPEHSGCEWSKIGAARFESASSVEEAARALCDLYGIEVPPFR